MKIWFKVIVYNSIIMIYNFYLYILLVKMKNVWICGYRYIIWFLIYEFFICKDWVEVCKLLL